VRFTTWLLCTPDQIKAYDRLVESRDRGWLSAVPRLPPDVRHFRTFFDEVGCYDLLATDYHIEGLGGQEAAR